MWPVKQSIPSGQIISFLELIYLIVYAFGIRMLSVCVCAYVFHCTCGWKMKSLTSINSTFKVEII